MSEANAASAESADTGSARSDAHPDERNPAETPDERETRQTRIAVYGGTFDPFHNGHLAVARYLREACGYGLVLVVPAGKPWLRERSPAAPALARLRMCQLATADDVGIEVSDVDVRRIGSTYTVDTISDLRSTYGDATQLDVVIGADAVASLHRWHRIDELRAQCEFVVIGRPGIDAVDDIASSEHAKFQLVDGPSVDVDATTIRRAYSDGDYATASSMVPPAVHRFIVSEELYWCVPTK